MNYPHLPPAPEGYEYKTYRTNGQAYVSTGYYPLGAPTREGKYLAAAPTLFIDYDLVDYLAHRTESTDKVALKESIHSAPAEVLSTALAELLVEARKHTTPLMDADPTIWVCTGYGYHAYYWLRDPASQDIEEVREANKNLVARINSSAGYPLADPKAVDAGTRLGRPPGTFNTKGASPRPVTIVHSDRESLHPLPSYSSRSNPLAGIGLTTATRRKEVDYSGVILDPLTGATLLELCQTLSPERLKYKLRCPFHEGTDTLSAFINWTPAGAPYLHCSSKSITYAPTVWTSPAGDLEVADKLQTNKNGLPIKSLRNLLTILSLDPTVERIWYDTRKMETYIGDRLLEDIDLLSLKRWVADTYYMEPPKELVFEAVTLVAKDNESNPLLVYLEGVSSSPIVNGGELLDTWLIRTLALKDTPLHRAYSRKFLIGAVARAYSPGCKVHTMLTVIGPQGYGKSSTFDKLTPPGYFSDTHLDLSSKDSYQQLSRAWIYEIGEMASFTRREHETIKAWISSREDTYRAAYARLPVTRPRHTVLVATSNDNTPLTDATGSRRYWVVTCGDKERAELDLPSTRREEIWGAAVQAYKSGEIWYLTEEEEEARTNRASTYSPESHYLEPVSKILGDHGYSTITVSEICDRLAISPDKRWKPVREIPPVLIELGAARLKRRRIEGERVTSWVLAGERIPEGMEYATPEDRERNLESLVLRLPIREEG